MAVPRFGELCSCSCLPLQPELACSIHATWGPSFSRAGPCTVSYNLMKEGVYGRGHPCTNVHCSFFAACNALSVYCWYIVRVDDKKATIGRQYCRAIVNVWCSYSNLYCHFFLDCHVLSVNCQYMVTLGYKEATIQ